MYYRGCWHRISRCLFVKYRHLFFFDKRSLQPTSLLPPRDIAPSGFRPLRKIPHCCLPQKSGPCLSPSVADRPLKPTTDHCLGKPLPHQQTNQTQAPLLATVMSFTSQRMRYQQPFPVGIPHHEVGSYALLTRPPLNLSLTPNLVRLACVKHDASVHPEPGSNSP